MTSQTDQPNNSALIITGVWDGPLTNGSPKGIELYANEDIPDLSSYGVGSANNGRGTDSVEFVLSGSASAGDYIYIVDTGHSDEFINYFNRATTFEDSAMAINGNDAIELFEISTSGMVVIDTFGNINVDGNGQPWEYTDGWAYRTGNTSTSFKIADWSFSGVNALDGTENNLGPHACLLYTSDAADE